MSGWETDPAEDRRAAAKRRLIRRLKRIVTECEQLATDKASWNDNRPEEMPFEFGEELGIAATARQILGYVEAGQDAPQVLWDRLAK